MNSPAYLLRLRILLRPTYLRPFCSTPILDPDPSSGSTEVTDTSRPLRSIISSLFREDNLDLLVSNFKRISADRKFRNKQEVYEVIIRRLAAAGRLDAVHEIIELHKRYEEEIPYEGFAVRLISLYGIAGMPDHAAALFQELPALGFPRTVFSFNAVLTAYSRSKRADLMDTVQNFLSSHDDSIEPNHISYNILINTQRELGLLDDALKTVDLMEQRGIKPNLITFNILLNGFYRKGMTLEGDGIWKRMTENDIQPNMRSFNAKIRAFTWQAKIPEALEVLEEIKRVGLEPDTLTFNALIKGYCQQENLEEAKGLYKQMGKKGCFPDKYTLRELVPKLCGGGEVDFAFHICKRAIKYGFKVDVTIVQAVIDELVKASLHDKANELVKRTKSKRKSAKLKIPLSCLA